MINKQQKEPGIELGLIFIINYPFDEFDAERDKEKIDAVRELETGYFGTAKYIPCDFASVYFITCFPGKTTEAEKSPNTRVRRLVPQKNSEKYRLKDVVNFGVVNLGNKDVLSGILTYVKNDMNAKKYVLFFYNHSSNFGMFRNTADSFSPVRQHGSIIKSIREAESFMPSETTEPLLKKMFARSSQLMSGGILGPEKKKIDLEFSRDFKEDMLTNSELHIALYRAFELNKAEDAEDKNEKPIAIIFSAGCFFQNIDMAYALRKFTDYLVGAQGIMPPQSYIYPDIVNALFRQLNNNVPASTIDYKGVIEEILKNFGSQYEQADEQVHSWLDNTVVSAVNCGHIDALKNSLDEFVLFCLENRYMIQKVGVARGALIDISKRYPQQTFLHLYDLKNFVQELQKRKGTAANEQLKIIYEKIENVLARMLDIDPFIGKRGLEEDCKGFSIYFPPDFSTALETYNFTNFYSPTAPTGSFFAQDSLWREFMFFYYKLTEAK